jgi:hypothetical protein
MINKIKLFIATFFCSFIFTSPSQAALLQIDSNGILTGATGVLVEGAYYDVTFVDGSCINLFSGCNESSDFNFTTQNSAVAAAQAILDQVFIGMYDENPYITFGCRINTGACGVTIPYLIGSSSVTASTAWNYIQEEDDRIQRGRLLTPSDDFTRLNWNYAIFSPSVPTEVPESSHMILLSIGLIALLLNRKRLRSSQKNTSNPI